MIQTNRPVLTTQRSLELSSSAVMLRSIAWLLCATLLLQTTLDTAFAQEAASAATAPKTSSKRSAGASSPSDVEVWEYSPYRSRVWLSISPTLGLSEITKQQIREKVAQLVEIEFGATMQCDVVETPDALFGSVLYHLDDLTIDQLLSRELVLMLAKGDQAKEAFLALQPKKVETSTALDPKKKLSVQEEEKIRAQADAEARAASLNSVRTLESVIERIPSIAIPPLQFAAMQRDIVPYLGDEKWSKMKSKLDPSEKSFDVIFENLKTGKSFAALVPKAEALRFKEVGRPMPTRFPWQPEAMLRDKDKIFMVSVDTEGEMIRIAVKELDAFVRRIGLMESTKVANVSEIANAVAYLQRSCFTPMARIEENDNKTAVLRVRANGLATSQESPVHIGTGDVLAPFIRRDDMNGNPTVLQNIAFTYIAVTEPIDAARFYGAIFAASRGSLVAAKNRRTKRVALKLQPRSPTTELKLGVRGQPDSAVPGAEVYLRTPGSEDLQMVGRTDWRGAIPISNPNPPVITYDEPTSSSVELISRARATAVRIKSLSASEGNPDASAANATPDPFLAAYQADEKAIAAAEEARKKREKAPTRTLQIKLPLYLYYIKNGETLLARLPVITGFRDLEKADLPDDRRRLQAEAFLKGLQGEVLDLVVRRKILDARIRKKIDEGKRDEAFALLDELKKVKTYDGLSSQIQSIQRRATSTDSGPIPTPVADRIDKMIDMTRVLMQKYLQDDIVRELEVKLLDGNRAASQSAAPPAATAAPAANATPETAPTPPPPAAAGAGPTPAATPPSTSQPPATSQPPSGSGPPRQVTSGT